MLGAWWRVVTVEGESMLPTLRPGDRVLVRRTPASALHRGDVVMVGLVANRVGRRFVLKRVAALPGDRVPLDVVPDDAEVPPGMLVLLGDNPDSSVDSRDFGYVPADWLFGVMVRRLR